MKASLYFADEKIRQSYLALASASTEEQETYTLLKAAFDSIAQDAFGGIQIPKRLIPKEYIKKYDIDNLWKYNLPDAWRLLYSVGKDGVVVLSIIIEWVDHKGYEKRFHYT